MLLNCSSRTVLDKALDIHDETVKLRRWFHQHPESSLKEYNTSKKIKEELERYGIPFEVAGETGVVGIIKGDAKGANHTVALRADIDALEIEEQNDVPYKSVNKGLMHACGHDGHIASLLTAANILVKEKADIPGTVKLIFQPAEEIGYGADIIINSGLVKDVEAFYGFHVTPILKTGYVSVVSGPIMAGANSLKIEVTGRSGHGAKPNQAIDAVVAGSAIVQSLQHIVSREADPVEPVVVTVGKFNAGTRENIIANKAVLAGTVRIVTEKSRENVSKAVKRVVGAVADAYRVKVKVECEFSTPIVINDEGLYEVVKNSVETLLDEDALVKLPIEMATDDFAVYNEIAPAFYVKVGVGGESAGSENKYIYPLHNERFNLDENSLAISSALYVEFVHQYFDKYRDL